MRAAGAKRIVNAGSAWQHYRNAEYSPVGLYAATKKAFADLLQYFVEAHGVHAVTLELSDTYGPGDVRRKLIPLMLEAEQTKRGLSMVRGELPLNFVHVDDAVSAFMVAAKRLRSNQVAGHEVFAVRSNETVVVKELFEIWEKARGTRLAARWGERPYRPREVLDQWTQGAPLPGWEARISLAEGLAGCELKPEGRKPEAGRRETEDRGLMTDNRNSLPARVIPSALAGWTRPRP